MSLEELVKTYTELRASITELEEKKKAVSAAIMQLMEGKKVQVADYIVRRYTRLSIKLSIEEARSLDAVVMEEAIDRDKIKTLYQIGHPMKGVSEIESIQVVSRQLDPA